MTHTADNYHYRRITMTEPQQQWQPPSAGWQPPPPAPVKSPASWTVAYWILGALLLVGMIVVAVSEMH